MTIVLFLVLGIILMLESSVMTLPLTLLFLITVTVWRRSFNILLVAFVSGIILDVFLVRPIGTTSSFFVIMIAGMILYQKKYELRSPFFVVPFSMASSMFYAILFPVPQAFLQIILSTLLSIVFFFISYNIVERSGERRRY